MKNIENYEISFDNLEKMFKVSFMEESAEKEHGLFQDALNISEEVLEEYYKAAYRLIEEKRWEDASDAFLFLTFINPNIYNFWIGLGISMQSQGAYDRALPAYAMAQQIDPEIPISYANAFQCCVALKEKECAENLWKAAIECCGENEEWTALKKNLNEIHALN
jgi:type III secretion system low calcium response chaperone LcrH/SycD